LAADNAGRDGRGGRRCVLLPARAAHAIDAKKVFNQRCTACHTFGKGVKVGPDLKGVTARRQRPWLLKFVRSSQR
jgi:protein SCO1/2